MMRLLRIAAGSQLMTSGQCTFPVLARPDLVGSGRMVVYSDITPPLASSVRIGGDTPGTI
jgi:hypothetical protein